MRYPTPSPSGAGIFVPCLALVIAVTIWASSFVAMKVAVMAYSPVIVIFGRMAVASVLFGLVALRTGIPRVQRKDIGIILLMALCEPCLYFIFEAYALRYTSASQAGMVAAILPLMVAGVAFVSLGERPRARTWAGFVIAVVGVVWLSAAGESTDHAPNPALGNMLEFGAMVFGTGYMVLLKRLSSRYSPWFLTAVQALVGAFFYLPGLALPMARVHGDPSLAGVLAILYLGSFVTIGAYGLYNFGLSRLPASQASAFVNLIPVLAALMGTVLLRETFTTGQIAASVVVLLGVGLSQGGLRRVGVE